MFPQEVARTNAGLIATFTQGQRRDALVLPNAALFVREADSPTLFLKPGDYSLELSGYVSVELRAQYTFRAKVNGSLELSINKTPVLKFESHGEVSEPSKPIRLNRGTNALHLRFVPPKTGDASFQILWSSKNALLAVRNQSYGFTPFVLKPPFSVSTGSWPVLSLLPPQ